MSFLVFELQLCEIKDSYRNFDNPSDQLWWEIQDIVGPAENLPNFIVNLFFTQNLNHAQSQLICAFVLHNGLNPEVNIYCIQT